MRNCFCVLLTLLTLWFLDVSSSSAQDYWVKADTTHNLTEFRSGPNGLLFALQNKLVTSNDEGNTWSTIFAQPGLTAFAIDSTGRMYAGCDTAIFTSTDNGSNWSDKKLRKVHAIEVSTSGLLIGCDSGLYISTDKGGSWDLIFKEGAVDQIAPATGKTIFIKSGGSLYRTIDLSKFEEVYRTQYQITQIAIDGMDGIYLSIAKDLGGSVEHSTDYGASWNGGTGIGFSSIVMNGVVVNRKNEVYAIGSTQTDTNATVFNASTCWNTNDGGLTGWNQLSTGLPATAAHSLGLTGSKRLITSTDSGVYRSRNSTLAVGKLASALTHSTLESNYPNPVTTSTTFAFYLKHASYAELHIVNLLGQIVATVASGEFNAGEHNIAWSSVGLRPGVYAYELVTPDSHDSKFLTLVK
jgi:hypothetical protein